MAANIVARYEGDNRSANNPMGITINKRPITDPNYTFYKYDRTAGADHYIRPTTNFNDIVQFQYIIRILDMIKDGTSSTSTIPNANRVIKDLMGWNAIFPRPEDDIPYSHLDSIVEGIQEKNRHKIRTRTWLQANAAEHNNDDKLPYTYFYKESGINPLTIIDNEAHAVSNCITEFIDPLNRAYEDTTTINYFPNVRGSLHVTEEFLNIFGFRDCSLLDRRVRNGTDQTDHDYQLHIAEEIQATQNDFECPETEESWYEGNRIKNLYFNACIANPRNRDLDCGNDEWKKALLNVKELGDVLQVLVMFITIHSRSLVGNHIMVTCDRIVFILCIQLGLNCILYQHPASGTHAIQHFVSAYTVDSAKADFNLRKAAIIRHNQAMIRGVQLLREKEYYTVELAQITTHSTFKFCDLFFDHIIHDMHAINTELESQVPQDLRGGTVNQKIMHINNQIKQLNKTYKIKQLFTYRKGNNIVRFSTSYNKYTEEIPQLRYRLLGPTNGTRSFYSTYKNHYAGKGGCPVVGGQHKNVNTMEEREILEFFTLPSPEDESFVKVEYVESNDNKRDYNQPIDIHKKWYSEVYNLLRFNTSRAFFDRYEYDIWWNLYDYCNNEEIVVTGNELYKLFKKIIADIRVIHTVNQNAERNIAVASARPISAVAARPMSTTAAAVSPMVRKMTSNNAYLSTPSGSPKNKTKKKKRKFQSMKHRPTSLNSKLKKQLAYLFNNSRVQLSIQNKVKLSRALSKLKSTQKHPSFLQQPFYGKGHATRKNRNRHSKKRK